MKRIVSTALVISFLTVTGVLAVAPAPWGSVVYAEVSDKEIMDQLAMIKKMVSDIEMKMKSEKKMMDSMGKEKTMKMLMEATKMLEQIEMQR